MPSYIIGCVKYTLEKRNLLCKAEERKPGMIVDIDAVSKILYYPKGKAFVLDTIKQITNEHTPKVITQEEARAFMDAHPDGIDQKNYIKFFGRPKEL